LHFIFRNVTAGVFLTQHEMTALSKVYDPAGTDLINYTLFLADLHVDLNPRRRLIVARAYSKLSPPSAAAHHAAEKQSEHVSIEVFWQNFKPELAPDVRAGKAGPSVFSDFMVKAFNAAGGKENSFSEMVWQRIWADIGAAIPSDAYFVDLVESTMGVREREADAVSFLPQ
jgi:hypothetical protein